MLKWSIASYFTTARLDGCHCFLVSSACWRCFQHPALKSFFLSQDKSPAVIRKFFENDLSELYLWHLHSVMSVFQSHIGEIERENNSLLEVINCLKSVQSVLRCRTEAGFMPFKVKELLAKLRRDGLGDGCDAFCLQVNLLYTTCLEYLAMWTVPLGEFNGFAWMTLNDTPTWDEVAASISYLKERKVEIDDGKCFDQLCNLKRFVELNRNKEDFIAQLAHEKWVNFFKSCKTEECFSELLIITEFFFAIPAHNANTERVFSLMQSQWTKERSKWMVDSVTGILFVQHNFKHMSCKDFYTYINTQPNLLKAISSSEKYSWAQTQTQSTFPSSTSSALYDSDAVATD